MVIEYWKRIYQEKLEAQQYSESSVRAYVGAAVGFFKVASGVEHPNELGEEEINRYVYWLVHSKKVSVSNQRTVVAGIDKFYSLVLGQTFDLKDLYPKRDEKTLPKYLSREEIKSLILAADNMKHKCVLEVLYGGGLRLNELLNLKVKDIDSSEMLIHIRNVKGKEDRTIMLSSVLLSDLEAYLARYKPQKYVFEGFGGGQYSARSVQTIVANIAAKTNIGKKVTPHTLRHSFAIHLFESGADIRLIQDLLGHKSLKTTQVYTQIAEVVKTRCKSPLDAL